ncbi:hypothetical protein V6N13_034910 [Hibiscus sabdariffa]|uniref:Uncharacterized protein n=1 Tax=Hibiscus sabdariffa TaxID=183260 RepID=A0ABR2AFW0_9ROSI
MKKESPSNGALRSKGHMDKKWVQLCLPSYNSFAIRNRRLTNPRWTGKATGSMSHTPDLRSTGSPGKIHNGVNQARLSMLPDLSVDWECPIGRDINARPKRCSNHRYEMKCDKSILGLQADARAPLLLS